VDDPEALSAAVEAAVLEGADAVIGGMTVAMICRARGIASVMIESGRKTVLQAVDEAIRTVRLMRQERSAATGSRASWTIPSKASYRYDRTA
jgi:hypothetical protein